MKASSQTLIKLVQSARCLNQQLSKKHSVLLGLSTKFLPCLSEIAQQIRQLTNKDAKFIWLKQHNESFEQIRKLVTRHPMLKYYNILHPEVTIQCDASEKGLGATLLQNSQPVAFTSRTLSHVEQWYAQKEKKCLAIVFACAKFSQYITRRENKITVESDQKPLQAIFKKSLLAAPSRVQRMLLRLQKYSLEVSQMYVEDHLSRAFLKHKETNLTMNSRCLL